jgi:hypothetical protein
MAKNIFLDQLNNNELLSAFGAQEENAPLTPEELAQISMQAPEVVVPQVAPIVAPKIDTQKSTKSSTAPKAPAPPAKDDTDDTKTTMSKSEALIAEYQKMLGKDQQSLEDARSRDRMLKVGGSIGDALATYLNAQGQMNVKAPGVQVQQGAGLGKIADMFTTAPEIQSDVAARREALMKQYAELAKGERAQDRLTAEKEMFKDRMTQQERLTDKELKALENKATLASEKEDRLTRTAQLNAARGLLKDDPRAKKAVEQGMALESIEPLLNEIESGNEMSISALGSQLARAMGEVGVLTDTDVIRYVQGQAWGTKLKDWWARGAQGEIPKEAIDGIRKNIKAIKTNLRTNLTSVYSNAAGRMKTAHPELDDATINGLLGTPALKLEVSKPINQDTKIKSFMKKNKITNKDEAIKILKENGKL